MSNYIDSGNILENCNIVPKRALWQCSLFSQIDSQILRHYYATPYFTRFLTTTSIAQTTNPVWRRDRFSVFIKSFGVNPNVVVCVRFLLLNRLQEPLVLITRVIGNVVHHNLDALIVNNQTKKSYRKFALSTWMSIRRNA